MNDRKDLHYDEATQKQFQVQQLRKEAGMKDPMVTSAADEEYAADLAAPLQNEGVRERMQDDRETETRKASKTLGYVALICAIASLFVLPALLGVSAVILGLFAFMRGTRALGTWSMVLGLISIAAYFFLVPYYT
jgi:hypothetical protein